MAEAQESNSRNPYAPLLPPGMPYGPPPTASEPLTLIIFNYFIVTKIGNNPIPLFNGFKAFPITEPKALNGSSAFIA